MPATASAESDSRPKSGLLFQEDTGTPQPNSKNGTTGTGAPSEAAASPSAAPSQEAELVELLSQSLNLDGEEPWESRIYGALDADGESLVTLGPAPAEHIGELEARVAQVAATCACDCTLVHTNEREREGGARPLLTNTCSCASCRRRGGTLTCALQ